MNQDHHGAFALTIGCIDGREILALIRYLKEHFPGIDYFDHVKAPGADGILSGKVTGTLVFEGVEMEAAERLKALRLDATVSMTKHHPEIIFFSSHYDCAGNPGSEAEHVAQMEQGVEVMRSWGGGFATIPIICLYIDETWEAKEVLRSEGTMAA
jgi:hypothetical protein